MRILLCTPPAGHSGGISRWTEHVINYYNQSNKEVDLFIYPMPRKQSGNFTMFHRIVSGMTEYLIIIINYWKKINEIKPTIIHIVSSASISLIKDLFMLQIAKIKGFKGIVHFRFGRIPAIIKNGGWEYFLLKHVIAIADKVIVIDSISYSFLKENGYKNIEFLPNPLSNTLEELISKNNKRKRIKGKIVFAGHMYASKGIFELVEACSQIPNIKLIMLGQLNEDVKIKLINQTKMTNHDWLELKGNVSYEEVIKNMLSCNIFILPSYTEGFPNVIIESMACNCPIIATNVGAIPEMLAIGNEYPAGICIEPKNSLQIKESIELLLKDENYAHFLASNAQKRVNEMYNIHVVWNKLVSIWETV